MSEVRSAVVLGGRFKVYSNGKISKMFDGVESPANVFYTGKTGRRYQAVSYTSNGKQKHAYVHRLIATAFIPNPDDLPQVNHIDGNKLNNNVENLEWCTAQRNVQHAYEKGLNIPSAGAQPCDRCGIPTMAKDGICPMCKREILKDESSNERRAKTADRFGGLDRTYMTEIERLYVDAASRGLFVAEIADEFGVTKQCVSAALLNAERKAKRGFKPSKAVENMRISLVNKVGMKRKKYEEAVAKAEIAKADYDSAISAYEKFEQEFLNK